MAITNTTIAGLAGSERKLQIKVDVIRSESNELVQSGLTTTTAETAALAAGGPRKVSLDYIKPLATDAFNVSNDDINDEGDVGKQEGASYSAHRLDLNYAWGTSAMTQIVTQYGSTGDIATGVAGYQNAISKSLLESTLKGVRASIAAAQEDEDDGFEGIVFDISTGWADQAIFDAVATAEEWQPQFTGLMISHGRYAKLQGANSGFVSPNETNTRFANYKGFNLMKTNILTDDEAIPFRIGALGYGEGTPQQAFEVERKANGGNGGGADILHARFSRVLAPLGMDYKGAIAQNPAQVKAFLEAAASWGLIAPVAQFGFRFIKFNAS